MGKHHEPQRAATLVLGMRNAAPGTVCVAVVDDDDDLRTSFARLLRAAGMQPFTYASAEAFLTDSTRPRFDCLVLDVQLPGMSGLSLHQQLNAEGNQTEVLFITAYDNTDARKEAYAMGCAGYFHKGASGRHVLNAIRDVVARGRRIP